MHAMKVTKSEKIFRYAAQHNNSLMVVFNFGRNTTRFFMATLCEFYFRSVVYSHKPAP